MKKPNPWSRNGPKCSSCEHSFLPNVTMKEWTSVEEEGEGKEELSAATPV
jgi:hypothetical protein